MIRSDPIVTYCETLTDTFEKPVMSKSANKHNRIYATAAPLNDELALEMENGTISMKMDKKELTKALVKTYDFDKNEVSRIWSFGPNGDGPNMVIDSTRGCQFMNEIKDSCVAGFQIVTNSGALCEEGLRGARFDICDTTLHTDSIHRGAGQIIPVARRVFYACQLSAAPRLQEPVFLCEITCPNNVAGNVYSCLAQRRGVIDEEIAIDGTPLTIIKAFLPVSESFGFTGYLRSNTAGQAFPNCVFDHWDVLPGDPFGEDNQVVKIINEIRKRKGLKAEVPVAENYIDKL